MWNSLRVSIYTTPEYRPQEFAGEEFYFATIEEFEIAIDIALPWFDFVFLKRHAPFHGKCYRCS
jgi:guanylate kinase